MRRREFIALVGGAVTAALPRAVLAQSSTPVVGFLDSGSPNEMSVNLAGFHKGLGENGFTEGKNVMIEYRWAEHRLDQLPKLAADLVERHVAVIAATRSPAPGL